MFATNSRPQQLLNFLPNLRPGALVVKNTVGGFSKETYLILQEENNISI